MCTKCWKGQFWWSPYWFDIYSDWVRSRNSLSVVPQMYECEDMQHLFVIFDSKWRVFECLGVMTKKSTFLTTFKIHYLYSIMNIIITCCSTLCRLLCSQIDRGMVIYICFFKGATDDILPKMGQWPFLTFWPTYLNPSLRCKHCPLSVHSAECTAVWVRLGEDGVGAGAPGQRADRPSGHAGREVQRQSHAVPQQHQQGGRAAAVRQLHLSVWEGTDGCCFSWGRSWSETRDLWEQTSAETGHERTLHTPDGVLTCRGRRGIGLNV